MDRVLEGSEYRMDGLAASMVEAGLAYLLVVADDEEDEDERRKKSGVLIHVAKELLARYGLSPDQLKTSARDIVELKSQFRKCVEDKVR